MSIFFFPCQYMSDFAITLPSSAISDDKEVWDYEDGQGNCKRGGTAETAWKDHWERQPQLWRVPQGEREEVCGGQSIVRSINIWHAGYFWHCVKKWKNFCPKEDMNMMFKKLSWNGCLVSVVSFEREAKFKQEKNAEIKKLTAEIGTIKRCHSDNEWLCTLPMF